MSQYTSWAREPDEMRRALTGPDPETMRRWLAFLRIGVGGLYLFAFASKLSHGFVQDFPTIVRQMSDANLLYFTRTILEGFVLHYPAVFAWMVMVAELAAGSLLVLGLGTRGVAAVAILFQTIYLLVSLGSSTVVTIANGALIVALLVVLGTSGGWRWSLDESIVNRR
jgi:uncharacterized membrane protein YphA (DoxX/SURF4 family)